MKQGNLRVFLLGCLLLPFALAGAQVGKRPLSLEDIEYLLREGVTAKRVGSLVEEHGIKFEVTGGMQERLRRVGVDEEGMRAIERVGVRQRVAGLVARAKQRVAAKQLTTPAGDNALETYQEVLRLEPGHKEAIEGIKGIAVTMALDTAKTIQAPWYRARALRTVSTTLAEAGDIPQALKIANTIQELVGRAMTLSDLATAQAKLDDRAAARESLVQAREIATTLQTDWDRHAALSGIATAEGALAVAHARFGDRMAAERSLLQALEIAEALPGYPEGDYACRDIAIAQAEAGDVAQALKIANSIGHPGERIRVLKAVAAAQTRAGDVAATLQTLAEAREAATSSTDPGWRDNALAGVAIAQAEAGDVAQALKTADIIEYHVARAWVVSTIAAGQAKRGDTAAAQQLLVQARQTAMTTNHAERMRALSIIAGAQGAVAAAQAKAGNRVAAQQTLAQALEIAATLPKHPEGDSARRDIATTQAEAGDIPQALKIASTIQDPGRREWALRDVAIAQAKKGEVAKALQIAGTIEYPEERIRALKVIGAAQAKVDDSAATRETLIQALEVAKTIQDPWMRALALEDVGVAQAESGDIAQALNTANAIEHHPEPRIDVLKAIVKALAKTAN